MADSTADYIAFTTYNRGDREGHLLAFEYDPFLVALVKKVPHADRAYYHDTKAWWIAAEHLPLIRAVAQLTGYTQRTLTPQKTPTE